MPGLRGGTRAADPGDSGGLKPCACSSTSKCPRSCADLLEDIFSGSLHVRQLGAGGSSDMAVWQLAQERECLLVTKDEDFHRLSVLRGAPPKVVWLRLGNCSTDDVAAMLRKHSADIRRFAEQNEATFLELG